MTDNKDYTYTANYNLDLYGDNSPADLRDGYNSAMRKLDAAVFKSSTEASAATHAANQAYDTANQTKSAAQNATNLATTAGHTADEAKSTGENHTAILNAAHLTNPEAAREVYDDFNSRVKAADFNQKIEQYYNKNEIDDKLSNFSAGGSHTSGVNTAGLHKMLIAHRCSAYYPEQSTKGALFSISQGWVPEVDVRLTADGYPVLCHDASTGRTLSGISRNVSEVTLEQWNQLTALPTGAGGYTERANSLDTLLRATGTAPVLIEIKDLTTNCADAVMSVVNEFGLKNDVYLQVFDTSIACYCAQKGFHTWALYTSMSEVKSEVIKQLTDAKVEAVHVQDGITSDMVSALHHAKLNVYAWTIDDYTAGQQRWEAGVDGITSNYPNLIQAYKGQKPGNVSGNFLGPAGSLALLRVGSTTGQEERINANLHRPIIRNGVDGCIIASSSDDPNSSTNFTTPAAMGVDVSKNVYVHVAGHFGNSTMLTNGGTSLIRAGVYSPKQNAYGVDLGQGFIDSPDANDQTYSEAVVRTNFGVDTYCKVGSGNNHEETRNHEATLTVHENDPFELEFKFTPTGLFVFGRVGSVDIFAIRKLPVQLPVGRLYNVFIGFNNLMGNYLITNMSWSTEAHTQANYFTA